MRGMDKKSSIILSLLLMATAAFAVWGAWSWPIKAALFPLVTAIPLFVLALIEVVWSVAGSKAPVSGEADAESTEEDLSPRETWIRTGIICAWIVGLFLLVVLLGFKFAVPLFVLTYLRFQGRESWWLSMTFAVATWGVFYGLFDLLLHVPFPEGWLIEWRQA